MSFSDELTIMRRFLRDPNGTIWTDAFIRHVYNDVQSDFQNKTKVLCDVAVQRVPGVYQTSYMHACEYNSLSSTETQFYRCLIAHDSRAVCYRWEIQKYAGIQPDVTDYGYHFTQPWEAYMCSTPGEEVRMKFPSNFHEMKFIAYDEEPIAPLKRKEVQQDTHYITRTGIPIGYYVTDDVENSYVLYPRPSESFNDEIGLDGAAFAASDDTEDSTYGIISIRSNAFDGDYGVPVDLVTTQNNVFMVYEATPTDMSDGTSESDFQDFLLKYIRYGTISRCYGTNTDGKIDSLAEYWASRYAIGVSTVKKYLQLKYEDRDYRLVTKGSESKRTFMHAKLPSSYPAVNP